MTREISFGTDGWRAVIADGFTFDNVRRVTEAVAVAARGLEPPDGVSVQNSRGTARCAGWTSPPSGSPPSFGQKSTRIEEERPAHRAEVAVGLVNLGARL